MRLKPSNLFLVLVLSSHAFSSSETEQTPDPYAGDACVICHRIEKNTQYIYNEWTQSVHYKNNVSCSGCHGGDPSVSVPDASDQAAYQAAVDAAHLRRNPEFFLLHGKGPEFESTARGRSVSYYCGRCHTEIMEKHLGSPHGDFGAPTCLYCHATSQDRPGRVTHAIQPATLDIVDPRSRGERGRCSTCHSQAAMKVVHTLKKLLEESVADIEQSAKDYAFVLESGYRYLNLGAMLDNSRQMRSRVRISFHSFNMREIQEACRAISRVKETSASAAEIVGETERAKKRQSVIGLAVSAFLLTFAGLLVYYRRRYCIGHEEQS